jgi:hypothetical protein
MWTVQNGLGAVGNSQQLWHPGMETVSLVNCLTTARRGSAALPSRSERIHQEFNRIEFRFFRAITGHGWSQTVDISVQMRNDSRMDPRAPERLSHDIVSRHTPLDRRTVADSDETLKFTGPILAGIELGMRTVTAGTSAVLQNQLAWAADSMDVILAGGEPKELVVDLYRVCQRNYSKLEEFITDKLVFPCTARAHGQLGRPPPAEVAIQSI